MDKPANFEENYDGGYQPSPCSVDQNDQSATGTTGYSTMSGDSFAYCRTNSEASNFSEPTDDNSSASEPSPSRWPAAKPGGNQAVLSRLGMKRHSLDDKLEDRDLLESGWLAKVLKLFVVSFFSLSK